MKRRKIIPYNPNLKQLARNLRNNSTKSEMKLWLELKAKKMMGYDFHRQKPIDNFIADFFCHELMLVIELDGYSHNFEEVIKRDKIKTKKLKALGLTVLRFSDSDIFNDINNVLRTITNYILDYEEQHTPRAARDTPPRAEKRHTPRAEKRHTPESRKETHPRPLSRGEVKVPLKWRDV